MVFLAEDTVLQRKGALKTMLPHVATSPKARERFLREARAAAAVEHAHVIGGNVWLEETPARNAAPEDATETFPVKVKLLDFGLARAEVDEAHLRQQGVIVGTSALLAPEQARGEAVDSRSDLFSLGCVLYVMLTGRRPFNGPTTMTILSALATETPPPPREVTPSVPAALSDFTLRLLAKKPNNRPPSSEAALTELRKLLRATVEEGSPAPRSPIT